MPETNEVSEDLGPKRRHVPVDVVMLHQSFDLEIAAIRQYIQTVTSSFHREFKSYEAYLARRAEDALQDEVQSLAEALGEAEHYLVHRFPAIALQTTFVATYTLLEDEILNLARLVGTKLGDKREPEHGNLNGIFAAKEFIEGHRLSFPTGPAWDEAVQYFAIRNAIAHCRGRVKHARKGKEIRDYVARNRKLTIDETDCLQVSDEFCSEVLDNVEALMRELFITVRRRF
jgi:hypothetical protein